MILSPLAYIEEIRNFQYLIPLYIRDKKIKFYQIVELYKNFKNLSWKGSFFHKTFCKSHFEVRKIKFVKMRKKNIFNGPNIVQKTFALS